MQPIVDRLEADFDVQVAFRQFNAADSAAGQQAFTQLALPGHPSFLIFLPNGQEIYRNFGMIEETTLREAIMLALNQS